VTDGAEGARPVGSSESVDVPNGQAAAPAEPEHGSVAPMAAATPSHPPFARLAPPLTPAIEAAPAIPVPPPPAVQSTRRLIGASFDLLTQSTAEMRAASFYIGGVVLATIAPLALATFAIEVAAPTAGELDFDAFFRSSPASGWFSLTAIVAGLGLVVANVESQNLAVAILGGRYAGRPIDARAALARSRMSFWRAVLAAIIVTVPVSIVTQIVDGVVVDLSNGSNAWSFVVAIVVGVLIGAPLAYLLTGIVLGDVDPFEATRRSLRVFKARKWAAALVALFQALATIIVLVGIGAGLEIVLGIFDVLGLDAGSGALGLAIISAGIVVGTFALGTLIYTALAISIAPQVVMFVGLTRATAGLDHVRPHGDRDPAIRRTGQRAFHWVTIPLWIGLATGLIGLVGVLTSLGR
jgi:hypothetical protein